MSGSDGGMSSSDNDNDETFISVNQAAKLLKTTRFTVVRMCDKGKLPGAHQLTGSNGRWRIPRVAVEAVLAATRPRKRAVGGA